jgi:hypothetical protein
MWLLGTALAKLGACRHLCLRVSVFRWSDSLVPRQGKILQLPPHRPRAPAAPGYPPIGSGAPRRCAPGWQASPLLISQNARLAGPELQCTSTKQYWLPPSAPPDPGAPFGRGTQVASKLGCLRGRGFSKNSARIHGKV